MAETLPTGEELLDLLNLNEGRAVAQFNIELQRVFDNIADMNTPAKSRRIITMKVIFVPDESRQVSDVLIDCEAKLAGQRGMKTSVALGKYQGQNIAVEANVTQGKLFDEKKPAALREVSKIS